MDVDVASPAGVALVVGRPQSPGEGERIPDHGGGGRRDYGGGVPHGGRRRRNMRGGCWIGREMLGRKDGKRNWGIGAAEDGEVEVEDKEPEGGGEGGEEAEAGGQRFTAGFVHAVLGVRDGETAPHRTWISRIGNASSITVRNPSN